jgi:hypothetical protein
MNTSSIGRTLPLVIAAILGGLISQVIPLAMQLHAQTNAASATASATTNAAPSLTPPVTTTKQYGVIDISTLKTESDVANSLTSAEKAGWKLKMGLGNYAIFTKQ